MGKQELFGTLCFFVLVAILVVSVLLINKNGLDSFKDIPHFFSHQDLTEKEKRDSLYSPFIIRPPERNSLTFTPDGNELFPLASSPFGKGEMGSPEAQIEAKYYAQTPLLNPGEYYNLLGQLFAKMRPDPLPEKIKDTRENFIYQNKFCQAYKGKDLIRFVMNKINRAKKGNRLYKALAKADTWGGEHWTPLDPIIFAFSKYDSTRLSEQEQARMAQRGTEPLKLVVNFTLYNTFRSIATNVSVLLYSYQGKYYLQEIGITSKNPQVPKEATLGGDMSPKPQWIYGNTIEQQMFNKWGTPVKDGHYIKGGIPQEFEEIVNKYPDAYLEELNRDQHPKACTGGTPCPTFPKTPTYGTENMVPDFTNVVIRDKGHKITVNV